VVLARDGQSAQADFVWSLRRIHSLGACSPNRMTATRYEASYAALAGTIVLS